MRPRPSHLRIDIHRKLLLILHGRGRWRDFDDSVAAFGVYGDIPRAAGGASRVVRSRAGHGGCKHCAQGHCTKKPFQHNHKIPPLAEHRVKSLHSGCDAFGGFRRARSLPNRNGSKSFACL